MFYMAGDDEDLSNPPGFARSMQDMVPALIGLALAAGVCAAQGTAYVSSEKDDALTLIDTQSLAVKGTVPTCKRGRHIQRLQRLSDMAIAAFTD